MKKIVFMLSFFLFAFANEERVLENKRQELELKTREYDEAKQALEAYRASFEALQREKMQALEKKEAELNATMKKIEQLKADNERILKQSEENLKAIESKTDGRIKEIYSSMKESAIADVLTQMDGDEATKIILSLEPRKISGVLSKMQPQKASELTLLIKRVDDNKTKENNASN